MLEETIHCTLLLPGNIGINVPLIFIGKFFSVLIFGGRLWSRWFHDLQVAFLVDCLPVMIGLGGVKLNLFITDRADWIMLALEPATGYCHHAHEGITEMVNLSVL